jgi:hypothetical protein
MTSKIEFFNLLVNNDLKDASILILANKQDLPIAKDAAELTEAYSLNEIQNHSWKIQGCCALTGEGLEEGLDWLTNEICETKQSIKQKKGDILWSNPVNYLIKTGGAKTVVNEQALETYEQKQARIQAIDFYN